MSGTEAGPAAQTWVSAAEVSEGVRQRWPDYQAILVAADEVDHDRLATVAGDRFTEAVTALRGMDQGQPDEHIARWHQAYRDFGVKPRIARVSVDALIRRARSDSGLPRINPLVDLYNAISILHRVPIGGEDLAHYDGGATLLVVTGEETFLTTAHGESVVDHPDPSEPVWVDANGVTCRRWNWRQTSRTAITEHTGRVGFIIDSLDAPRHEGARAAVEEFAGLLPGSCTRTL